MHVKYMAASLLLSLGLTSCVTYHISTESLTTQIARFPDSTARLYPISAPYSFDPICGKPPVTLAVLNKRGQPRRIVVTTKSTIRVTQANGRKLTFDIRTLSVRDSMLLGVQQEYLSWRLMAVPFNDIIKIEARQ